MHTDRTHHLTVVHFCVKRVCIWVATRLPRLRSSVSARSQAEILVQDMLAPNSLIKTCGVIDLNSLVTSMLLC